MHGEHDGTEPVSPDVNRVGTAVMEAAFAVHRSLGPGLLESVYEHCLAEELLQAGFGVDRQVPIPVEYRDARLDVGFRLDLLVEGGRSWSKLSRSTPWRRSIRLRLKDGFRRLVR